MLEIFGEGVVMGKTKERREENESPRIQEVR